MKKFLTLTLSAFILVAGAAVYRVGAKQQQNIAATTNPSSSSSSAEMVATYKPSAETKETTIDGIYAGQIDSNSIEVTINNRETALFFSEEVKKNFNPNGIKKGAKVKVTYYKNDKGQLILTGIKSYPANSEVKGEKGTTASGIYIGQMDNNSIEVKINSKETALYFSETVKKSFNPKDFKTGVKVQVTYHKNDKGQLIVTSIKRI
jgi:hypothetical protein